MVDDSIAGQIGLIIAIVVAGIVGLALIAHLVRPLVSRTAPEQPAEPSEAVNDHDERWARWEAGNSVPMPDQSGYASPPGESLEMVIESMTAVDLPPDQALATNEVSPNAAIGASIFATVSALLECANDGAMLSGFGLYSDRFFRQFAVESGLSLDDFVRRYQSHSTRQSGERLRVDRVDHFVNLPDGRISAHIHYGPAGVLPPESYVFAWSSDRNRWLIDDIQR
jgi:hypothetical protein